MFSNLLKSTALVAGLTASANALTHYKSGQGNLVKRDTELGNTGITYNIVEEGLSTSASFTVDYDDMIVINGYVVSSDFSISADDTGFSVSATYDNATQFCEEADMWMMVYTYDDSVPALIAPDCGNIFTLIDPETGDIIDWSQGGCISIGSFAAANPVCASLSATASAVSTSAPEPTTYSAVVVTETVSGVVTSFTTYCPLSDGTPVLSAMSTSVATVSDGVTTTVEVPCSRCIAAAQAGTSGSLMVETTYVSGTVTVTSMVPCETPAPTTYSEIVLTKTVAGTATVFTTYCPLSNGTPVYSAMSSTHTTVSNGVTTTVVVPCSECSAAAGSTGGLFVPTTLLSGTATVTSLVPHTPETTTTPLGTALTTPLTTLTTSNGPNPTTEATPSVMEGAASFKTVSSGLIAAVVAILFL